MNFIKKILAHPFVKKFISAQTLKKILLILTGVGIFVLIFKWYRQKRTAGALPKGEEKLSSSSLLKVWKEFVRRIPSQFRRPIMHYQPVVVLGEAGYGKTLLIEKYTDWKGQGYKFYPSHTENPNLQIYLGAQVLVQEIPSTILNDTSKEVRGALVSLWNACFKKRTPIVIVALKADALGSITPDALRRQAQMIRGKVNIITQKKEVEIRIALTHMDRLEGFSEFSKFLQSHTIPLKISLQGMNLENELRNCLEPYEVHLPRALAELPSLEYKAIVKFLSRAPEFLTTVSFFLHSLVERDPLTPPLTLHELYLVSNTTKETVSNPFGCFWPKEILSMLRGRMVKHRFARNTMIVLCSLALVMAYFYERSKWYDAEKTLASLQEGPSLSLCEQARMQVYSLTDKKESKPLRIFWPAFSATQTQAIEDRLHASIRKFYISEWTKAKQLVSRFVSSPSDTSYQGASKIMGEIVALHQVESFSPMLAGFYQKYEKELKEQFTSGIRDFYLIPKIGQCMTSQNPHENTLYLLSVIYASNTNYLGKQILANLPQWQKNLGIPEKVLQEYVSYSDTPWGEPIPLSEIPKTRKEMDPANMPEPWITFFLEVEKCLQRTSMTPKYLEKIREEGKPLAEVIFYLGEYALAQNLFNELDKGTRLNVRKIYAPLAMSDWITKNNEPLRELFRMINESAIVVPSSSKNRNLPHLTANIRTLLALEVPKKNFEFRLEGKEFKFSEEKWHTLIQNSKIVRLMDDFISQNKEREDHLLFSGRNEFEAIEMNPYNDGTAFFTGKTKIAGEYTREAYEREIRPNLTDFSDLLPQLTIDKKKKDEITNFVFEKAQRYAINYRKAYLEYYRNFNVNADSIGALHLVLTQMQLPAGAFIEFLKTITDNTMLDIPSSLYFGPLQEELQGFKPIHRLIASKENPEIQKYYTILQTLKDELLEVSPKKDKKKEEKKEASQEDDFKEFEELLPPVGRLALPILARQNDSYLAITQTWLKSVGIVRAWQRPFLLPVHALYDLGLVEIEKTLHKNWERRVFPIVSPFLSKFPFNLESERDVIPLELESAIHPQGGKFWQSFHRFIAPVCDQNEGAWEIKPSLREPVNAPKEMLLVVNHLWWLSRHVLWDKEGNPRPIVFPMKSAPLPAQPYNGKYATLACLSLGNASYFNFNQQPTWQSFSVSWWKQETAKIILEYTHAENREKSEYSILLDECFWGFFKLLRKSKLLEKELWTWNLPDGASDYTTAKVRYYIQGDPWKYFGIKDSEK